jgi:holo-[acyl-carrier protein] synthase
MRIIGHGIDMTPTQRIARMVADHGEHFLTRVFSERELTYAMGRKRRDEHLAARFAAKEAVLKALGTGWSGGIGWTDVEVTLQPSGAPGVQLHGRGAGDRDGDGNHRVASVAHAHGGDRDGLGYRGGGVAFPAGPGASRARGFPGRGSLPNLLLRSTIQTEDHDMSTVAPAPVHAVKTTSSGERVFNFSAGPGCLPDEVLHQIQSDVWNIFGTGIGILEHSHRGKAYDRVLAEAEADFRKIAIFPATTRSCS